MDKSRDLLRKNLSATMGDMNQAELARRVGVAPNHISNYLSGKNVPSLDRIDELAEALGTSTFDLIKPPRVQALHPDSRYESLPKDVLEGLLSPKDNETALNAVRMIIKANVPVETKLKKRS